MDIIDLKLNIKNMNEDIIGKKVEIFYLYLIYNDNKFFLLQYNYYYKAKLFQFFKY